LGVERKLFYREMIARFGHHLALQWNVSEEYDYKYPLDPEKVKAFAGYIQRQDPYDHPITVHNHDDPDGTWVPFLGDGRFSSTSFQYSGDVAGYGAEVEKWRAKSKEAGRPVTVSMDELRSATLTNADVQRKQILWPTYLSGGSWSGTPRQRTRTWRISGATRIFECTRATPARLFEENLPFWEMESKDELLVGESDGSDGGGGQVFAKVGEVYAVYLPDAASSSRLDLSAASGDFRLRWYNPRTGDFEGTRRPSAGTESCALEHPPAPPPPTGSR
jgi:hypothetical protein